MEKQDILKVVRANEGTVLSFPDRGPWGKIATEEIVVDTSMHFLLISTM